MGLAGLWERKRTLKIRNPESRPTHRVTSKHRYRNHSLRSKRPLARFFRGASGRAKLNTPLIFL